jgi:hypothetical protein
MKHQELIEKISERIQIMNEHMYDLYDNYMNDDSYSFDEKNKMRVVADALDDCMYKYRDLCNFIYVEDSENLKLSCFIHNSLNCFCVRIEEAKQNG